MGSKPAPSGGWLPWGEEVVAEGLVNCDGGESASGREGKQGVFRGETNFFAVHMFCGVVLAKKVDQ